MVKTDILVVGGGPAGILAGMASKQTNSKLKVTLIKKDKGVIIRCSEPYVLGKYVSLGKIISSDKMIIDAGINLVIDEAIQILAKKRIVKTKNKKKIKYKKLILATGACPFIPPIEGINLKNTFTLRDDKDVKRIQKILKNAKNIVIIGGGAIGVEIASILKNKKRSVTIIELLSHLLPNVYDKDFSENAEIAIRKKGIKILTQEKIVEIFSRKKISQILTASGKKIPADLIILTVGVRSEVKLAQKAGIKIGKFGIWTKKNQETNFKNIYACGDCAQAIDYITSNPTPSQLATTAVFQGKVAGVNAAGGKTQYMGVVNPAVTVFCNKAIGRVGLTEKQAKENKFKIIVGRSQSLSRYACHPGAEPQEVKIIFEKKSKRILGAQIFGGKEGLGQMINLLSLAIQKRLTAFDLAELNYCAHPELTPLPFADPIVMASEGIFKKS